MEKQTSDHVFDLFFENSIDLLCIADKSGNFVKLNNAWTDTLGYQLTELEGRPYIGFVHPEDVESTIQATKQLANNQKVQHFINRYKHKNGTYRWIEWLSYPSEDTVYASAHDITDRIEVEQALKESESKYRKIVEDLPLALCVADIGGNITYINNTFLKYFGYDLAEIPTIEKWALLAFAGEEINKTSTAFWQQNIEEITQTKTPDILPKIYSVRTKSGKIIETEITLVKIGSELYIFFNDITEKQKAEEALQKRVMALTKPLDDTEGIKFTDLFNIEELQKVQDTFSDATGVASIITQTDGTPITRPSNFCNLCNLIRGTEKGRINCFKSDKIIGKQNIDGPIVQPCYSGGLWDAGAGITLGGKHFANWLIGQVRNEVQDESEMLKYADKIGVDREQFRQALKEVPMMSKEQFEKVSQSLFVLANQLSLKAYQNVQQARFIAEQKKAEKELADAKALLDTALMQTPIPMVVISAPDYVVQLSNSACIEILGIDDESDYIGKSLLDQPPTWQDIEESGSQIPLSGSPLALAINGIETKNKEYFIKRKDGTIRWASVSASPIRNSQGDVIAAYLVFPDITERKINEEEIQKQDKLHQTILDTITIGLTFVKNRKQEWVNQSHCKIFGYEHEEMIGLETSAFYANVEDYEWIGAEGYNRLANGEVYFVEMPMKKKDGSIIWCSIAGKALDHKDLSKGSIWTLQDIDDRKKTELEIKKLNSELEKRVLERTEQLQQANKDLESFAYSISHDLRAPLRHIDGFVNLLYSNIPEPLDNVTNYYKKINAATKRLTVMIEELLAFSRLGRKEISYSNVNLQLLVSNVIENLKPEFAHRKIKWIIGNLPVVYGDLSLLQFAFENIISNSIKYTGKKKHAIIELGTISKKENESGLLTVFIKDNGAGFDMKYADKLFGVFQRLHTNEEFEGVGIGLANVKQIVTKHKGTISAESEADKGATFFITLPEPSDIL